MAVCAACGAPCPPPFRPPPPEQAPDLDGRPGEPARSTLARWPATCRGCGASAPDLARLPAGAAETVATDAYRALNGPGAERAFLRYALLCEAGGDAEEAGWAVLQAAWTCDDAGRDASALRRRCASLWGEPATVADGLRLLDVLRRAGEFDRAGSLAQELGRHRLHESDEAVLAFQRTRIEAGDAGRHQVSSALRPPSRTPHASHRPARPRGGLWRLLPWR